MVELGIAGAKKAGKTTLMVELIQCLTSAGAAVATAKHTGHSHTFDTDGKDSQRHRQAGAELTLAVSDTEVALFAKPKTGIHEKLLPFIRDQFDWFLVEGDKRSDRPKVFLTNNSDTLQGELPSHIIVTYGDDVSSLDVPHFSRGDVLGLIAFLSEAMFTPEQGTVPHV